MSGVWIAMYACFCAGPIILENSAIRIEVDPQLFSVQFAGFPGGANFMERLLVEEEARAGSGWVDPGGLVTDVFPAPEREAVLRRGPASVEFQDAHSVILLGPVSEKLGVRMKKELRLEGDEAKARYTVTLLAQSQESKRYSVRNTVRVPLRSTIRVEKEKTEILPLAGLEKLAPVVVRSMNYWLIPVPPTSSVNKAVLGAAVLSFSLENRSGFWKRTIEKATAEDATPDNATPFFCVLDDATRSYGAALQSASQDVSLGAPLVFTESWEFVHRGTIKEEKPEKTEKEPADEKKE